MWITLFGKQMSVENIRMIDVLKIRKNMMHWSYGNEEGQKRYDHPLDMQE